MNKKVIGFIYLCLIHGLLLVTVISDDYINQIKYFVLFSDVDKSYYTNFYRNMIVYHQRIDENMPNDSVVFIGDSMVQGLAVNAITLSAINFGIGQDTTLGVINRIALYKSLNRSKLIVIAVGTNDLKKTTNQQIMNNYRQIRKSIPHDVPVLFSAVLPKDSRSKLINKRIKRLNQRLKFFCNTNKKTYFMDISPLIMNSEGVIDEKYHIGDGLHLNKLGNDVWIQALSQYIKKIIV